MDKQHMEGLISKAETLIESLPYMRKFAGKTFVIKYGGHAMVNEELKKTVILDVIMLKYIGINPILVHGGGTEIDRWMHKIGKEPEFSRGMRITDHETMELAEMVLVGKVNRQIVGLINAYGGKAVGVSGKDANLLVAHKMPPRQVEVEGKEEQVDLGQVGEIAQVNPGILRTLVEQHYIPVVSSIGNSFQKEQEEAGGSLNINADYVAGALAASLQAEKLILLTDVEGIMSDPDDPSTLISSLTEAKARSAIEEGAISRGMIPKVEACLKALHKGAKRAHIINGRVEHSLLLEIFTDHGIGTMVEAEAETEA